MIQGAEDDGEGDKTLRGCFCASVTQLFVGKGKNLQCAFGGDPLRVFKVFEGAENRKFDLEGRSLQGLGDVQSHVKDRESENVAYSSCFLVWTRAKMTLIIKKWIDRCFSLFYIFVNRLTLGFGAVVWI